jgi:tetratricopeptide (TPR) repeat protein
MERFPSFSFEQAVSEGDFLRFSQSFSEILLEKIPTAKAVTFHTTFAQLAHLIADKKNRAAARALFNGEKAGKEAVKVGADSLLLPFTVDQDRIVVAHVSGLDPLVTKRAAKDWLADTQLAAVRDFLYLKQARTDSETGLFNSANLFCLLDILSDYQLLHLVLIELPPRNRSPRNAFQNARTAAFVLQGYAGGGLVHHLGQCVFAILLQNPEKEGYAARFGSSLVASLKREGFHRVHIGSSSGTDAVRTETARREARDRLLTEAWSALQTAGRRGPFGFCDYSVLAHPEKHPLCPFDEGLARKIRRKYRETQQFCLVELKKEGFLAGQLADLLCKHIEKTLIFSSGNSVVLFLEGYFRDEARRRIGDLLQAVDDETGEALQISAGIGHFPYADFEKGEILANCRKALLHAAFFGAGAVVAFDAISLNISGDIYYGDGDLPSAVREYRRGLVCEAGNVNLLNSLGVAYAMLDRHALARESFKKALAVEPNNFMSLYNLGLGEALRGNMQRGVQCFEQAILVHCEEDGPEVKKDLQFQLAKLYCRLGLFSKAYALLMEGHAACNDQHSAGPALRYLGESCFGLGQNSEAKIWLQMALRFNEFDPDALGLLGQVYLEEGEGNEIALTLCEKSVELNPSDTGLRLRLAKVQISCGLLTQARLNLTKCLGDRRIQAEAQFCIGRIYQNLGRKKQAKRWFGKVLQRADLSPELIRQIQGAIEN